MQGLRACSLSLSLSPPQSATHQALTLSVVYPASPLFFFRPTGDICIITCLLSDITWCTLYLRARIPPLLCYLTSFLQASQRKLNGINMLTGCHLPHVVLPFHLHYPSTRVFFAETVSLTPSSGNLSCAPSTRQKNPPTLCRHSSFNIPKCRVMPSLISLRITNRHQQMHISLCAALGQKKAQPVAATEIVSRHSRPAECGLRDRCQKRHTRLSRHLHSAFYWASFAAHHSFSCTAPHFLSCYSLLISCM